ncbi:PstS family phosphate ABC transporter substrate-binding protein [Haloferax namakaokahaiae]|uniref:PstS family phosphate ABC transporter substrate-binding protein n=1 Tax=Haloferax namakaokahaiae TaxID=1748331 RepID=A0ABD5Z9I8_9EURY
MTHSHSDAHDSPARLTRRRTVLSTLGTLAISAVAGCLGGGDASPDTSTAAPVTTDDLGGELKIAGSSTVYPLTLAIGSAFMEGHPNVTVSVTSSGTGGGFADFFCAGRTVINDASRRIETDEMELCESRNIDPIEFQVATDALTVAVNPEADWIDCLTLDELAHIWRTDGATTWRDVRPEWPNVPIERYGPTPASGTFDYFSSVVLGDDTHRRDHEMTEQDNVIARRVSDSKNAIGYFGLAYYLRNRDAVRAAPIDDGSGTCVEPSPATTRSGAYGALSRPLYIYVARDRLARPEVAAFVHYYLERSVTVPAEIGYVPVDERTATTNLETLAELRSTATTE